MIKVKNWSSYQSYKDRRPPWIRFHRTILDNYDYQSMSADSRALLPMLWLLACEHSDPTSGLIDLDFKKIAFRLRLTKEIIAKSISELESAGFIDCNETVTKPLQHPIVSVTTETEAETETELLFESLWNLYGKKGNRKTSHYRFIKLKKSEIEKLIVHLPLYVKSTPDPQYRKGFESYLNLECWNDAIVAGKPVDSKKPQGREFRSFGT